MRARFPHDYQEILPPAEMVSRSRAPKSWRWARLLWPRASTTRAVRPPPTRQPHTTPRAHARPSEDEASAETPGEAAHVTRPHRYSNGREREDCLTVPTVGTGPD